MIAYLLIVITKRLNIMKEIDKLNVLQYAKPVIESLISTNSSTDYSYIRSCLNKSKEIVLNSLNKSDDLEASLYSILYCLTESDFTSSGSIKMYINSLRNLSDVFNSVQLIRKIENDSKSISFRSKAEIDKYVHLVNDINKSLSDDLSEIDHSSLVFNGLLILITSFTEVKVYFNSVSINDLNELCKISLNDIVNKSIELRYMTDELRELIENPNSIIYHLVDSNKLLNNSRKASMSVDVNKELSEVILNLINSTPGKRFDLPKIDPSFDNGIAIGLTNEMADSVIYSIGNTIGHHKYKSCELSRKIKSILDKTRGVESLNRILSLCKTYDKI